MWKHARVCVGVWMRAAHVPAFVPPWREGFLLEPFQLLMHYRQIGPQIGLFAVDWHHTEMTSPLKWRGPPLTLWPLLKQQLQYNSFMSWYGCNLLNNTRVLHLPLEKWMSPTSNQGASCALVIKTAFSNAVWISRHQCVTECFWGLILRTSAIGGVIS